MVKTELPEGWTKHFNEYGKVYYFNENNNTIQTHHPLTKKFRNYYHELLT